MTSRKRKNRYIIAIFTLSPLMSSWYAVAEEGLVAVPTQRFGLQAKVQTALTKQIDGTISTAVAEHIAQQHHEDSAPVVVINPIDKKRDDSRLVGNLPQVQ